MAPSPSSPKSPRSPQTVTNGCFRNGSWYCNCEPRRLARKKTVTKNTKNYGRGFYVCNIDPKEGNVCGFFLWIDEAEKRERASFSTNGRSEKRQTTLHESITPRKGKGSKKKDGKTRPDSSGIDGPGTAADASAGGDGGTGATLINAAAASESKKGTVAPADELRDAKIEKTTTRTGEAVEQDKYNNTTSDEEDDEVPEMNSPSTRPKAHTTKPAVPPSSLKRKRTEKDEPDLLDDLSSAGEQELLAVTEQSSKSRNAFETPSSQRTTNVKHGMPTPSLTQGRAVTTKKVLFENSSAPNTKRPRHDTAVELWGTSAVIEAPDNLTKEVMEVLQNEQVGHATRGALRKTLDRHVALAKGLERGRDAARKAAKDAEERAARLQAKVDALETSRQDLRTQLMDMWNKL